LSARQLPEIPPESFSGSRQRILNASSAGDWQDDWEDGFDFGEFEDMQPVAASASRPGQERAQRNLGNLRTHVQYAMKAFQGMLAASVLGEDQQGVLDGGGSYGEQTVHGHAGVESCFSGPHEPLVRAALGGNAGGDIDDMLNSRENAGECVLSPSLDADQDTEWNIPDLNLIFRPPKFLMEAMAIGISPGNWVKLAPTAAAGLHFLCVVREFVSDLCIHFDAAVRSFRVPRRVPGYTTSTHSHTHDKHARTQTLFLFLSFSLSLFRPFFLSSLFLSLS